MQEHKARARCRRNGEGHLWSHDLSYVFIGMITKPYHRGGGVARGMGTFSRGRDGCVETRTATATRENGRQRCAGVSSSLRRPKHISGSFYTSIGPDREARVLPCSQVRRRSHPVQCSVGCGRRILQGCAFAAASDMAPQYARTLTRLCVPGAPLAEPSTRRYWCDRCAQCACHSRSQRGHSVAFGLRERVPEPGHHPGRVRSLRIAEQALHNLALLGR